MESATTQQKPALRCPFTGKTAEPSQTLSSRLREATREAHDVAERHPVQGRMARGAVSRSDYANWLEQMHHIWSALDAAVADAATVDARIAALLKPYHVHAPRIAADLAFLGRTGEREPASPGTQQLIDLIRATGASGAAVIGPWYVMEGSNNGGRFLAKALSRGLEISGPEGLMSLDPHGDTQKDRWLEWRSALDAQHFSDTECTAITDAASCTFAGLTPVFDDLPVAV